jgi:hypothetical protein
MWVGVRLPLESGALWGVHPSCWVDSDSEVFPAVGAVGGWLLESAAAWAWLRCDPLAADWGYQTHRGWGEVGAAVRAERYGNQVGAIWVDAVNLS